MSPHVTVTSRADRTREAWDDARRGDASWFTFFSGGLTSTAGMVAGVMDLAPDGGVLLPHRHSQAEIYFVSQGTGTLTVDGASHRIPAGTSAFIPGNSEHSVRNDEGTVLTIFYVFPADSFDEISYQFSPLPDTVPPQASTA